MEEEAENKTAERAFEDGDGDADAFLKKTNETPGIT